MPSDNLRLLIIIPYFEPAYVYGGPVKSIPALCKAISKTGVSVEVFTTDANGEKDLKNVPNNKLVDRDGVSVYYFHRFPKNSYFVSINLMKALINNIANYDIVQIHGVFSFLSLIGSILSRIYKKPYFIFLHGMLMPWAYNYKHLKKTLYMKFIERGILTHANGIISTDPMETSAIDQFQFGVPILNITNGLDLTKFEVLPPYGKLRKQLSIPLDHNIILVVGRIHPIKRPDLALEALILTVKTMPNSHLIFCGPDEANMASMIISRAKESGVDKNVHFTGLVDTEQVIQLLTDADIFLSTSESENFGMAIVEAMAAGLPVVVSNKVGLSRIVREANSGISCDLTAEDISRSLVTLLEKRNTLKTIGARGRDLVFERYEILNVAQSLINKYESLLNLN